MSIGPFSKKTFRTPVSVAVLIAMVLFTAGAAENFGSKGLEPSNQKPLWRIDLHSLGFARDYPPSYTFFGTPNSYSVSRLGTHSLAFSPKDQIAVAFVTLDIKGSKTVGRTLHLASFDAAIAQVITVKDEPTRYSSVELTATDAGNFLLQVDNSLILFSPKLEKLNELDMEPMKPRDGFVSTHFSADGRYIFVDAFSDLHTPQTIWTFNANTFQQLQSRTLEAGEWAASVNYLARWQKFPGVNKRSLYVRSEGTEWTEIYSDAGCSFPFYRYGAYFLTDSLIAIQSCNKLTVADTAGRIIFMDTFPPNRPLESQLRASFDGRRFAISLGEWKGIENKFLDLGRYAVPWRVLIYDTRDRAAISTFAIPWSNSFALSSDSKELALLRSGILELFPLPAPVSKP